ncbi:MAG: glycosyltransferase family 4 protein [Candidatus Cloacimonadota bacterium]|nr:glycosyltransferase family 4 protein [Candidatus Cloacimonadota bacterium]
MRILYISQYFYPEICAPSNRAYANAKCLAEKGHDVVVLTEMPNHPKGVILDGYKGKLLYRERMDNFWINRVWIFTCKKKNFMTRLLFYISFMFLGTIHSLFNWGKYDIVYISSPPLFVAGIGILLKFFFPEIKIVFEVRDLWPESAIALGELKNKLFISLSKALEKRMYKISEKIIVISKYIKSQIIKEGIYPGKIKIIYNGTDEKFVKRNEVVTKELFNEYKRLGKFLVVYAGNIGIAQGLDTILKAALRLNRENILFLFIGSGPKEVKLKQIVNTENLNNVKFIGEVPREKIHEYLYLADCGIIPLRRLQLYKGALPSKIFDYMGCGLPILLGIKGEAQKIVEKSGTGITFEPDDSEDLAQKILWLKRNPEILKKMSSKGKTFVLNNFNRKKEAQKLEQELVRIFKTK